MPVTSNWPEIERTIEQELDGCLKLGKRSPEETVRAAARKVDRLIARATAPPRGSRIDVGLIGWGLGIGVVALLLLGGLFYFRGAPASSAARAEERAGFLFISPWFLGLLLFTAGPIATSAFLSFCEWSGLEPLAEARWVGAGNYGEIFSDALFYQSLRVTAWYTVLSVPFTIGLSLGMALLLNAGLRGQKLFRTIYYLPSVVSGVAVAVLWLWIFNPRFGAFNFCLGLIGIDGPDWLTSERWALPAMVIMGLWSCGGSMLTYLAGLQGIPKQLYEAASIDGAGTLRRFVHVTLPMLSPVIFFNLVMGVIGSFQVFTQAYVMTGGAPDNETHFYGLFIFNKAFNDNEMGYGCALAWILFFIVAALTAVIFKTGGWVHSEEKR